LLTQHRRVLHPDADETALEALLARHHVGLSDVYTLGVLVPDEGAAATQIACGQLTMPEVVGLDRDGDPCRTVLEHAHDMGKATGLVTDATLSGATTASFAAKQPGLDHEDAAAADLITGVARGKVQVMLGGGAAYFIPKGWLVSDAAGCEGMDPLLDGRSARADGANLIGAARDDGY